MIDLVLHGPGLVALHLVFVFFPGRILGLEADLGGPDDVAGIVGHGETAFASHLVALPVDDLGVDEHQVAVVGHGLAGVGTVHDGDALETPHLWRGNAHRGRPLLAGQFQLLDERAQLVVENSHLFRDLLQPLVRNGEDRKRFHPAIPPASRWE